MDGFVLDDLVGEKISEKEKEIINLIEEFEDVFGYSISRNLLDVDNQQLRELLKKSLENKKDYLQRYIIREIDMMEWIEELIVYIAELELFPETEEINNYIYQFFEYKELYRLNVDEIYGVIHHLYKLISEILLDKDIDAQIVIEENPKIKEWAKKTLEELVNDSLEDLWEPKQLQNLYVLCDEIYEIAEKTVYGVDCITELELQKVQDAPKKIEIWKDELDLQRFEYRKIEDIEFLWTYFSTEIQCDCEFIRTRNLERASERLRARMAEETNNTSR